jgi:hypothetical protein
MNKENAHLFLPLIQALIDGKQLQYKYNRLSWEDFEKDEEIGFNDDLENYRIKPEPRTWDVVPTEFAEQLERELTAVTEQRDRLAEALEYILGIGLTQKTKVKAEEALQSTNAND